MSLPSTINELLMGGTAASYTIGNSLRFRSSASAYLSRSMGGGTSTKFTISAWVKRGALSANETIFEIWTGVSGGYGLQLRFNTSDQLVITHDTYNGSSGFAGVLLTTSVFRDPSAWYHIILAADFTAGNFNTFANLYVNGVSQTLSVSGSTYGSWGTGNITCNTGFIGAASAVGTPAAGYYLDGYQSEVNFVDGQSLTPSSFGETDSTTGVWKPKRYSGSYGTKGFYLKFNDGSSTTTLGYDSSGNSNNWTTNNISLTTGATYDWMIDSPTSYAGTSYGVGNYCVLNPLSNLYGSTISNGNLTTSCTTVQAGAGGTFRLNSGKWYYEYTVEGTGSPGRNWLGYLDNSYLPDYNYWPIGAKTLLYANDGTSGVTYAAYGASYTTGDVIGVAFDITGGTITFYKNGTSQGNLATGISGTDWRPIVTYGSTGWAGSFNFGQRPFAFTPPSGYKSLCTQNLPAASITNGAQHMAATLYTGNGSTQSITNTVNGIGFQPDLVWGKLRTTSSYHRLSDSVRGASSTLATNVADAEVAGNGLVSFDASGFSMNSSTNINQAYPYVAWQWKAGGTAVTNTSGTISSQVSANPTAGFSIVTHTGTGSSATIGHGLGVAPSMVITKMRSSLSTEGWTTWHTGLSGGTYYVYLQSVQAQASNSAKFSATPTSTVINVGNDNSTNGSGYTYVSYCFAAIAGYSTFGSYTGNGSADGPFVYCGFRPRYVLVKRTDSTADWTVWDTTRNSYNVATVVLCPNLSGAESSFSSGYEFDILSNGFKCRSAGNVENASGGTYIYAAFAENPFQNSLAR